MVDALSVSAVAGGAVSRAGLALFGPCVVEVSGFALTTEGNAIWVRHGNANDPVFAATGAVVRAVDAVAAGGVEDLSFWARIDNAFPISRVHDISILALSAPDDRNDVRSGSCGHYGQTVSAAVAVVRA